MSNPKLHHYVPMFYLRRFTDASGRLWVLDRDSDHVFQAQPNRIAVEKYFYYSTKLAEYGHDPLTMEKQFSHLEGEVSLITGQWLEWLRQIKPGEKIAIPNINRELVSVYAALQFLRTADSRAILAAFVETHENRGAMSAEEKRYLHIDMLWNDRIFRALADRVQSATWVFGRNTTTTPFITSDNPVAFRTHDNAMWLKVGAMNGTYAVFPLAPDIVMYCYPNESPWEKCAQFDRCLSPVTFSNEMVESENSAQVFMASRFVLSPRCNFDYERVFAKTIGTDLYAGDWRQPY